MAVLISGLSQLDERIREAHVLPAAIPEGGIDSSLRSSIRQVARRARDGWKEATLSPSATYRGYVAKARCRCACAAATS